MQIRVKAKDDYINSKPGFKANGLQSEVSAPKAKHSVTHSVTEENVEVRWFWITVSFTYKATEFSMIDKYEPMNFLSRK